MNHLFNRELKTRIVTFSYGTVKDADLEVPAGDFSAWDAAHLIRKSWLRYAFRPGCGLMSDEVLVSSIGKSNFFEGALGGYKQRLDPTFYGILERCVNDDIALATEVVRFREPNLPAADVWERLSKNEALDVNTREFAARYADNIRNGAMPTS